MTNSEEIKEQFCSDLKDSIKHISVDECLVSIGDFNVIINSKTKKLKLVYDCYGVKKVEHKQVACTSSLFGEWPYSYKYHLQTLVQYIEI